MRRRLFMLSMAVVLLASAPGRGRAAGDDDLVPPQLPKEQRDNLLRFLHSHEKPDRYIPRDAKVVTSGTTVLDTQQQPPANTPIKQYTVQITSHRPVPGQEEVKQVDVYYYRPNPEAGKPGVTIKHTVDLTTGDQVGPTEVLLNHHTPISREELAEAVTLARAKSPAVADLYKDREKGAVQWEYLQMFVSRKNELYEPGDRVVRFVFTAPAVGNEPAPTPVRILVNLTKGAVIPDKP